jgi:hypothetical protein
MASKKTTCAAFGRPSLASAGVSTTTHTAFAPQKFSSQRMLKDPWMTSRCVSLPLLKLKSAFYRVGAHSIADSLLSTPQERFRVAGLKRRKTRPLDPIALRSKVCCCAE